MAPKARRTTAPMPTSQRQTCRLLTLPPELRTYIFALILVCPEPTDLNDPCRTQGHLMHFKTENCGHWINVGRPLCQTCDNALRRYFRQCVAQPALARVCKHLRDETLPVFYSVNTFFIHSFQHKLGSEVRAGNVAVLMYVKKWLKAIGKEKRKMLRRLFLIEDRTSHRLWLKGYDKEAVVRKVAVGEDENVKSELQILHKELKEWKYRKLEFK